MFFTPRKKKLFYTCLAIFFGLSIGLILAESSLRLFAPAWLRKRMESVNLAEGTRIFGSSVGWSVEKAGGKFVRFVPGTNFQMTFHEWTNHVQIDAWGGRTVNRNVDDHALPFVPFLGDSFTFGLGVEDHQTFVSLLQKENHRYQYLNLGVPGSSLPHQIDILRFRHQELGSPHTYAFVFFAGNDYDEMSRYYDENIAAKNRPAVLRLFDNLFYRFRFFANLYLFQFADQVANNFYYGGSESIHGGEGTGRWAEKTPNGKTMADPVLLLAKGSPAFTNDSRRYLLLTLDHLEDLSKQYGFRPVFIIVPHKMQLNRKLVERKCRFFDLDPNSLDMRIPSTMIGRELKKRNIPYFDLLACFPRSKKLFYTVDGHMTPAGHAKAAECLGGKFTEIINAKR